MVSESVFLSYMIWPSFHHDRITKDSMNPVTRALMAKDAIPNNEFAFMKAKLAKADIRNSFYKIEQTVKKNLAFSLESTKNAPYPSL